MPYRKPALMIFALSFAGFLFSGYLSAIKLFSDSCAFNEPCPYFLGYPACWYGFAMYLVMFIVSGLAFLGKIRFSLAIRWTGVFSALGIIFAGSFFIQEVAESNYTGALGLSTCAYGLIFYILIFISSVGAWHKFRAGGKARG